MIERIKGLNLYGNEVPSISMEQPRPYQKGPLKWFINRLESVHPDRV